MADRWAHEPQYSHGFLVPVFALFLLWHRRDRYVPESFRGASWGLALVLLGFCMRLVGTYIFFPWLEEASLLPCMFGGCLLLGGWSALRWAWPALTFLLFMIPLPFQIESALAHPLQRVATIASAASLELLGFQATAEGNIVWVRDEFRLAVEEACGGLSMLLTFFALATAFALVLRRPWPDKVVLIVSAIPIALLANVARITLTGVLHDLAGNEVAQAFFHDLAGWFMMLLALGMLGLEVLILSLLLVERPEAPLAVVRPQAARPSRPVAARS
jgi:exosortase